MRACSTHMAASFTCEPGSLPGQTRRLAFAAFVSQSQLTGGAHAAPVIAALLRSMQDSGQARSPEQKGD